MRSAGGIVVRDVVRTFGTVRALDGVSLTVPEGSVHGLLGPNGAGKTTMVQIISTLLAPESGSVLIDGIDCVRDPHGARSRMGVAGQFATVDDMLTGYEQITMLARLAGFRGSGAKRRAGELLEQFDLASVAGRRVGTYSGGMRRRLDLAGAIVAGPPVVILDEPTASLDPASRNSLWQATRTLVEQGTTILLTTQYLEEADHLADTITVIDGGQVVATGTPAELKRRIGTATVTLVFHTEADAAAGVSAMDAAGVANVQSADRTITFQAGDPEVAMAAAVGRLARCGFDVERASFREPTLDEVFLDLTESKSGS